MLSKSTKDEYREILIKTLVFSTIRNFRCIMTNKPRLLFYKSCPANLKALISLFVCLFQHGVFVCNCNFLLNRNWF